MKLIKKINKIPNDFGFILAIPLKKDGIGLIKFLDNEYFSDTIIGATVEKFNDKEYNFLICSFSEMKFLAKEMIT